MSKYRSREKLLSEQRVESMIRVRKFLILFVRLKKELEKDVLLRNSLGDDQKARATNSISTQTALMEKLRAHRKIKNSR